MRNVKVLFIKLIAVQVLQQMHTKRNGITEVTPLQKAPEQHRRVLFIRV